MRQEAQQLLQDFDSWTKDYNRWLESREKPTRFDRSDYTASADQPHAIITIDRGDHKMEIKRVGVRAVD